MKDVTQMINKYEPSAEYRDKQLLSLSGFQFILNSNLMNAKNYEYKTSVYQDMTRPLCDYFIASSHNT